MTAVIAVALGVGVGLCLGVLGGGGSVLTVPALVYLLHVEPRTATTASLVIVGSSALAGAAAHTRAGRVRWGPGLAFGAVGAGASLLGSRLGRGVDPQVLLLAFAGLMVVAAVGMLRREGPAAASSGRRESGGRGLGGPGRALWLAAAAVAVGLVTGFFGVGGGFVIVPALVVALGYDVPTATATSLPVIAVNSAAALAERAAPSALPWEVVLPFGVAAAVGAVLGSAVAARASGGLLTRAFALLLLVVAAAVALQATAEL